MTQLLYKALRPYRIIRKKWRIWKTENPHGIRVAKFFARHRRRFLNKPVTSNTIESVSETNQTDRDNSYNTIPATTTSDRDEFLASSGAVLETLKYYSNPGKNFELGSGIDSKSLGKKVKSIAFFLPQFYEFEENNQWWGKGFTEWRNVSRGAPRFEGHYQPRIPRDLGFYNLKSADTLRAQAAMATQYGIEAFCFYYYWFNGKRLMDSPLDTFCEDDSIDQQFCIMWANENWTRTWDGHDSKVLIQQDYLKEDEEAFIADTAKYMNHERYLRVGGRPLFVIYRPGLLPNANECLSRWRELWNQATGEDPYILMVQGFGDNDPREFGLDGALEFPPHKIAIDVPDINSELKLYDPNFSGHVRSYDAIVESSLQYKDEGYHVVKTVSPHWDNDARREGRGMVLHGSTPDKYENWLNRTIDHAVDNPTIDEPIVFINAWNEWAESAYLEPDVHYGHAYLNATQRAIHGFTQLKNQSGSQDKEAESTQVNSILLVGHDAHKHGAQMLLLSLARVYSQQFGMQVVILLRQGGTLVDEYKQIAETHTLDELGEEGLHDLLRVKSFSLAICNTCVTGDIVPVIKQQQIPVVSLIHEMPILIEEFNLQSQVNLIDKHADHIVFPSNIVKKGFSQFANKHVGERHIRPQGTYKSIIFDRVARQRIRSELGIASTAKLVLNVGYADLRKGFDLFLQTAQQWMDKRHDIHFVWVGAIADDLQRWIQSDLDFAACSDRIHLVGFTQQMSDYYSAADALFLTSREDPYPTVVLEAMNVGLPVVLFKGATGFDSVISQYGYLVERGDQQAMELALSKAVDETSDLKQTERVQFVENNCQLDDYCFDLLQLVQPKLKKVSVVVPNYNYENYLAGRLGSIFNQDFPVFEIIVLDDCSSDNSLGMIESAASIAQRQVKIVTNPSNSGNVFHQWNKGLELSRGTHLWIAEADDLSDPRFLSRSIESFRRDTRISFTDSQQIDESGQQLAGSYNYYYQTISKEMFSKSFIMEGSEFIEKGLAVKNVILNVSSVVWDRKHLLSVMHSLNDDIVRYSLVGDWRIYLAFLSKANTDIAYIAEPLNIHRRHQNSVTQALDLQHHYDEIKAMHECAMRQISNHQISHRQASYREELLDQFNLTASQSKAA